MSAFQSKLRALVERIKVIPYGFKRVYQEGKEVMQILHNSDSKKRQHYTRRENELIRQHFASIRKLGLFFVVQLPPIIGYIPMFLALKYPRQILTYHFFDNNINLLQQFLREEFSDRNFYATELVCYYPMNHFHCGNPPIGGSFHGAVDNGKNYYGHQRSQEASERPQSLKPLITLQDWHDTLNIKRLPMDGIPRTQENYSVDDLSPREYLELLSKSNMICDSVLGATYSPSIFLRFWMAMRVKEIIQDDILLIQEGVENLSVYELQCAVLRRGFAPNDSKIYLSQCLETWLHKMVSEEDRNVILREDYLLANYRHSKAAALMHLIAFNSTITKIV